MDDETKIEDEVITAPAPPAPRPPIDQSFLYSPDYPAPLSAENAEFEALPERDLVPPKPEATAAEIDALLNDAEEVETPEIRSSRVLAAALLAGAPLTTSIAPTMVAQQPQRLSHRLKLIAQLAALGLTQREIATRTNYTQQRISVVLSAPIVSREVDRIRSEMFSRDELTAMRTMVPTAFERLRKILDDPDEKTTLVADVAFKTIERVHGRAKQQVELGGTLLKDVFALLDSRSRLDPTPPGHTTTIHAESVTIQSPPTSGGAGSLSPPDRREDEADELEDYLDSVVPVRPPAAPKAQA